MDGSLQLGQYDLPSRKRRSSPCSSGTYLIYSNHTNRDKTSWLRIFTMVPPIEGVGQCDFALSVHYIVRQHLPRNLAKWIPFRLSAIFSCCLIDENSISSRFCWHKTNIFISDENIFMMTWDTTTPHHILFPFLRKKCTCTKSTFYGLSRKFK